MRSKALLTTLSAALVTTTLASAQITTPPLSPRATVKQQVGLGEVTLDYGRPSARGREVFGGMEAWDVVWRTGANGSTKVTFSEDAQVGGEPVKAGTYGLYTIPKKEGAWTFILSTDSELWGAGGYDPANDALRIDVKPMALPAVHETLTIDMQGFHANGAELVIAWEKTKLVVPVKVDTDTRVLKEIDERVRNAKGEVTERTYYQAGMYLYNQKKNLEEAAMWIDKSIEMTPGAFWKMYYSAELAHHMGDTKKAKTVAEAALKAAKASKRGDFGYAARIEGLLAKLN